MLIWRRVGGGGGGELANLFVPMSLAIVTSRREKRASLSSFRKWRRRHLQIQLFQAGFPTYSSFKVFCVWTEKCGVMFLAAEVSEFSL